MKYAGVIIDISLESLDRPFTYAVPKAMEGLLREGMVVEVPFGRGNVLKKGYVISFSDTPPLPPERIKEIRSVCTGEETTQGKLIALADWMRREFGSTMIQALKTVLPIRKRVKAVSEKKLELLDEEKGKKALASLSGSRYAARVRVLSALLKERVLTEDELQKLGFSASVRDYLESGGIALLSSEEKLRSPIGEAERSAARARSREAAAKMSPDQEAALNEILREWNGPAPRPVLLFGVTGSGKTLLYMELIERTLSEGRQAIVLIPEIALTYQTVGRFTARFGEKVSVINSSLSAGERYDQFRRAMNGEISVMVGPRSALFTPFEKLGLIIIDEEHEGAYKSESAPRYHARDAAEARCRMEGASLLLGSATPSVDSYYRAGRGDYALVRLDARYAGQALPKVFIEDMRSELRAGNTTIFSRRLIRLMEERLEKKEQIMLFLNRRGYAGFVSCRDCGEAVKCPHCDVTLSEHNGNRLICHYCGYEIKKPGACPSCGSERFGGFKAGTQQVEEAVHSFFPEAGVLRMDRDSTRRKGSHAKILSSFASGRADILIGTQMIVKGHDFPNVTLVGILAADLSLNASGYKSSEETFQLLAQAAGRAGRGDSPGAAVIQSYHPEHYAVQAAARQDYEAFYREEIGYRSLLDYPPAGGMLSVHGACESGELLHRAMHYLSLYAKSLEGRVPLTVIGPAPDPVSRIRDIYYETMYIKCAGHSDLLKVRRALERYIGINPGFGPVQILYDM